MNLLESNLDSEILKSRLVVLYSYSTTMNLALAANVPTIVHVAPDRMIPKSEAEPYFSLLRKCGVIHDSPEEAAWHLNQIHENIEDWWASADVQKARKIWVQQFARTDRFWWWHWIKALAGLQKVG
jgi:putative transferase (TIGR04331 family)